MNRSEFWTVIAAVIVSLWTIWSDVAQVRKEIVDIHKTLAAIQVSIADLRTEMIRETSQDRPSSAVYTLADCPIFRDHLRGRRLAKDAEALATAQPLPAQYEVQHVDVTRRQI